MVWWLWKMSWQLLMKLNTDSPHNPAIPLLCMFPPKWKLMLTWKHVQACVLMNTIANNWKQPRCSTKWMATHLGASTWQDTIQWHSTAIKGTNYWCKEQGWIRDTCEKSQSQRLQLRFHPVTLWKRRNCENRSVVSSSQGWGRWVREFFWWGGTAKSWLWTESLIYTF